VSCTSPQRATSTTTIRGSRLLLTAGFLLETMRIAHRPADGGSIGTISTEATVGHRIPSKCRVPRTSPSIRSFPSSLFRSVDRSAYRLTPLTAEQKAALEAALATI